MPFKHLYILYIIICTHTSVHLYIYHRYMCLICCFWDILDGSSDKIEIVLWFFTCSAFWSTLHVIRSPLTAFTAIIIVCSIIHYDSDCIGGGVVQLLFANGLCKCTCWYKAHGLMQYFVDIIIFSTKTDS